MKVSRGQGRVFKVDNAVTLEEIHDGRDFRFDIAIGRIAGHHSTVMNTVSDRCYFVLEGEIDIHVGSQTFHAVRHDTVLIPSGTAHGLDGTGEYVVITAPPFAPENEKMVEQ